MQPLGLPLSMFLVFVVVILAGSLGAIHYLVVHIVLRRPSGDVPAGGPPAGGTGIGAGGGESPARSAREGAR